MVFAPSMGSTPAPWKEWGIYDGKNRINPVARSNVCPEMAAPAEPSFYAFAFTERVEAGPPGFVIAGSGEAREGGAVYRERTVRYSETSADAMRERRATCWAKCSAGSSWWVSTLGRYQRQPGLYRAQSLPISGRRDRRPRRGHASGLTWHYCRPPVRGLEYEMDCRAVAAEHFVE